MKKNTYLLLAIILPCSYTVAAQAGCPATYNGNPILGTNGKAIAAPANGFSEGTQVYDYGSHSMVVCPNTGLFSSMAGSNVTDCGPSNPNGPMSYNCYTCLNTGGAWSNGACVPATCGAGVPAGTALPNQSGSCSAGGASLAGNFSGFSAATNAAGYCGSKGLGPPLQYTTINYTFSCGNLLTVGYFQGNTPETSHQGWCNQSLPFVDNIVCSSPQPGPPVTPKPTKEPISPACFVAGTMVNTPNGAVAIEALKVGDIVSSYNVNAKAIVSSPVAKVFVHKSESYGLLILSDGTELKVTAVHPFYLPDQKKWVHANKLKAGMNVLKFNQQSVTIKSISFSAASLKATVYNIEVKKYHNYFANDVLVHNKEQP